MPSRPRPSGRRRTLLFLLLAVAVVAAAGFWLTTRADDQATASDTTPAAAPTSESAPVTDDPATTDPEGTDGAPVSTAPASEVATDAPAPTEEAGDEVSPELTYYGWDDAAGGVEAGGIVMGITESGGTCTLTLTQGTSAVDVSVEAVDNVSSTSCPAMTVPGSRLRSGTWQATLSYDSATSRGTGDAVEVEVP